MSGITTRLEINLEPHIKAKIHEELGRKSGVAKWIRRLIYDHFAIELPETTLDIDVRHVCMDHIQGVASNKLIMGMYLDGCSIGEIKDFLRSEKSGYSHLKWTTERIRQVLEQISFKEALRQAAELDDFKEGC